MKLQNTVCVSQYISSQVYGQGLQDLACCLLERSELQCSLPDWTNRERLMLCDVTLRHPRNFYNTATPDDPINFGFFTRKHTFCLFIAPNYALPIFYFQVSIQCVILTVLCWMLDLNPVIESSLQCDQQRA